MELLDLDNIENILTAAKNISETDVKITQIAENPLGTLVVMLLTPKKKEDEPSGN